ncbi:MAG: extracellular solute-binding protein, partial [Clostridia bacterium]|nr:extracellular solute-binding protein [Clostridia bacterium]
KVKAEDVKFLPLYMGIDGEKGQGLCIGTENYIAINKNASKEQQKASLDFLEWLFSSEKGKDYVTNKFNFITPFNTFSDSQLPNDPLAKEVVKYMRDDAVTTVPWIFTSFPSDTFKKNVGSALLDYVQGDKQWKDVEALIKSEWKSERK